LWAFTRILRATNAAVFHAHLNWPLGCRHGLIAAKLSGIPVILATAHLYSPVPNTAINRLKLLVQTAIVDRYLAVSAEVRDRLCQDLRIPESKVHVVRNGIRLTPFEEVGGDTGDARSAFIESSGCRMVFTPARLHSQKGHIYLIKAAALVPDAVFVLAGDGPEREALEHLAQTLDLKQRIRFLGHREDIPRLLASCDLFVLPSLYEGLPLSVLEAMAAGKPVIATAIGGTKEAVVHGETGLLVPPENPVELAAAIRTVFSDQKLALRLAKAGKTRATRLFSSETMVRGVTGVYDELLAPRLLARGLSTTL
jgi:glycosyltransferase involved in cell wall biosynthesis